MTRVNYKVGCHSTKQVLFEGRGKLGCFGMKYEEEERRSSQRRPWFSHYVY